MASYSNCAKQLPKQNSLIDSRALKLGRYPKIWRGCKCGYNQLRIPNIGDADGLHCRYLQLDWQRNELDGNDPQNALGWVTLDTTSTNGLVPLTFSLGNTGSFSFTATAQYTDYVLGIQTTPASPKPDYFVFNLADGVESGTYSINGTRTSATAAVLYGRLAASPVPGPVVGAGLPGRGHIARFRAKVSNS